MWTTDVFRFSLNKENCQEPTKPALIAVSVYYFLFGEKDFYLTVRKSKHDYM